MDYDSKRLIMKKSIFKLLLFFPSLFFAQVIIGTDQVPTATLDIEGDLRVRNIPNGDVTDNILLSDDNGVMYKISPSDLAKNGYVENSPKIGGGRVVNPEADVLTEEFIPTLDLWTQQEMFGEEGIKDVYMVSLSQRITLPQNITTDGDGKIRKIVFVLIQNNPSEGFDDNNYSQAFDQWRIYFQTKKFEMKSDGADCYINDITYIYKPTYSGLFVPDPANYYNTAGTNNPERSRLKGYYQDQIRDREFVFYDFNGKWVLSVRD